jgi:hypothetical protein
MRGGFPGRNSRNISRKKYISKNYCDNKMQYFFELKLGNMNMEEYEKKFL